MSTALSILASLSANPAFEALKLCQLHLFFALVSHIWTQIIDDAPPQYRTSTTPPEALPTNHLSFLSLCLQVAPDMVSLLWSTYRNDLHKNLISGNNTLTSRIDIDDLVRQHGVATQTSAFATSWMTRSQSDICTGAQTLLPPHRLVCPDSRCESQSLGTVQSSEGRLYTLRRGLLPIQSRSYYCSSESSPSTSLPTNKGVSECNTRYYHNYSITRAGDADSVREYYPGHHRYLQVHHSAFIEDELCEYFEQNMCHAQYVKLFWHVHVLNSSDHFLSVSAQNLARIYNESPLGNSAIPNLSSTLEYRITGAFILDAFFTYAAIRRLSASHQSFTLPHHAVSQSARINASLKTMNYEMAGTGQPMHAHGCKKCMRWYHDESDGSIRMSLSL